MQKKLPVNFYLILNVSSKARSQEIKKAYLKLAKIYHPDQHKGSKLAEKKFQQINSAWEVLKDPEKRKLFDEDLKKTKQKKEKSLRKVFSSPAPPKEKPIDLEFSLEISLEDVCQSQSKKIHYFKPVVGRKIKSSLMVQIPYGVRDGGCLRFKEKGGAEGEKVFGDLYVRIHFKPHKLFHLTGDRDLILKYPISFVEALESRALEVPSPYGFLSLKINAPLKHKQVLKIKGHGLPKNSQKGKGDLFVKILIDYPSREGKKIQEQMDSMSFERQKIYAQKFKGSSFIYPKVLKFQKKIQELKEK